MKHRSIDNYREYGVSRKRQNGIAAKMSGNRNDVSYTRRGRIRFAQCVYGK